MNKLLIVLLVSLSATAVGEADTTCTVTGFVRDVDGRPLVGATVLVAGTPYGAMTNLTGEYVITDVSSGVVNLNSWMVGLGEVFKRVSCHPGDTVFADFTLFDPFARRLVAFEDMMNSVEFSDTLIVFVKNWHEVDVEYGQVWLDDLLLPSNANSDSTISVLLPPNTNHFSIQIFPAEESFISIPEGASVMDVRCTVAAAKKNNSLISSPDSAYTFIDAAEWGDPAYENWGLLGVELNFNENGNPEVLLVYNEHAVLINEHGSANIITFPFPTLKYECDAKLNYLLIWDISGHNGVTGDVALIDMADGEHTVFDPDPDSQRPERNAFSGVIITGPSFWGNRYHVTSDGHTVVVERRCIRVFGPTGRQTSRVSLEEIGIEDFFYTDQFLSMDESAVSAVFSDGSRNYALTVDLEGNVLNLSPIPVQSLELGHISHVHDTGSAVLWKPLGIPGVLRIDCLTGDCIFRDGLRSRHVLSSPNRQVVAVYIFSNVNPCYQVFEVWDWNTGERLLSNQTGYDDERWLFRGVSVMSDNRFYAGQYPIRGTSNGRHIYLTDDSGRLLWLSPILFSSYISRDSSSIERQLVDRPLGISPDGSTLVFSNGRYLVIGHLIHGSGK